jgi:hypothetical protein
MISGAEADWQIHARGEAICQIDGLRGETTVKGPKSTTRLTAGQSAQTHVLKPARVLPPQWRDPADAGKWLCGLQRNKLPDNLQKSLNRLFGAEACDEFAAKADRRALQEAIAEVAKPAAKTTAPKLKKERARVAIGLPSFKTAALLLLTLGALGFTGYRIEQHYGFIKQTSLMDNLAAPSEPWIAELAQKRSTVHGSPLLNNASKIQGFSFVNKQGAKEIVTFDDDTFEIRLGPGRPIEARLTREMYEGERMISERMLRSRKQWQPSAHHVMDGFSNAMRTKDAAAMALLAPGAPKAWWESAFARMASAESVTWEKVESGAGVHVFRVKTRFAYNPTPARYFIAVSPSGAQNWEIDIVLSSWAE